MVSVPIVGEVAAGQPILAEENIIGEVLVESRLARSGRFFALEINGDSMVDAGINDRDLVVVRQQPVAENGDIIVALIDDEATVKRLRIREERIELRPENLSYRAILVGPEDNLQILGKVVSTIRTSWSGVRKNVPTGE
jgi:repressor LexA